MSYFEVGDKVEVIEVLAADERANIKVGDVAKVTVVKGPYWIQCENPEWEEGYMPMREYQIKRVGCL
ncbi:hypothetical protein Mithridates_00158 [Acinetobacter phage Mithridates]|nr:hypothetical protein Mithridates_00158 [Acinetobacter phage Mithridates]